MNWKKISSVDFDKRKVVNEMKERKMKKWLAVLMILILTAGICTSQNANAASQGYVFQYKGVKVVMKQDAAKIIKVAGKPVKKKESKSCSYKGLDRVYQYKDFVLATYSNSKKGAQYVNGIKFTSNKISTKEGVHLGSTLNDVQKKYGQVKGNFGVYTYKKGKCKLQFEITDGKVTTIQYVALK